MDIDIDVYFWMVDRGVFEDDQRNKVDMERNKVKMCREHSQKIENGVYLGKLLLILKKSVMKITRKPFSLDPQLGSLKDNPTSQAKAANWTILAKELKKFNVRLDGEKRQKIVDGRYQVVEDVMNKLFDFDNGVGPTSNRYVDLNGSEIMYGGGDHKDNSVMDIQMSPMKDDINVSVDLGHPKTKDSSKILRNAPGKKSFLEPLDTHHSGAPKGSSNRNAAVTSSVELANMGSVRYKNSKMNLSNPDVFNDIDVHKDLGDSDSTLEFILIGLSKNLDIKPKQAVGLLSNNHKYLIHIAVKGTKGGEFAKVQAWYSEVYANSKHLVKLIDQEKVQNSTALTLHILKVGLFSSNIELVMSCTRVLSRIGQEINMLGGQLSGAAWDWFINEPKKQDLGSPPKPQKGSPKVNKQKSQHEEYDANGQGESGLQACIYALKRHGLDFIEHIVPIFIQYGRNNYLELFNHHLKTFYPDKAQFIGIAHDILALTINTSLGKVALVNSNVIDAWIDTAIRQADYDGMNSPEERIAALAFLEETWELKAEKIEEKTDIAQAVLTMLKRGCRDKSKVLRVISTELMMKLLHLFSVERNSNAPILYKTLTFLLIEFHMDTEIREQMLRHFTTLFQQVQSIPVAILCEPLLKQIQISDGSTYFFNVFDFEFFSAVAKHKRLNAGVAQQIVEIMAKIAQTNLFFANSAIAIMIQLIQKFSKDPVLHTTFQQIFKYSLFVILEQERQRLSQESEKKKMMTQIQKEEEHIAKNTVNKYTLKKLQDQEKHRKFEMEQMFEAGHLARRTKEKLIVNMIQKLLLVGDGIIKQDLRMQLLSTYVKIEKELKIKSKAISYLLSLFGENVPQMLQYFVEHEQPRHEQYQEYGFSTYDQSQSPVNQTYKLDGLSQPDSNKNDSGGKEDNKVAKVNKMQQRAMKEIEKIKTIKFDQTQKKTLQDEIKKIREDRRLNQAQKKIEERKIMHGVIPNNNRAFSEDKGGLQKSLILKAKDDTNVYTEDEDFQRLLLPVKSDNDYSIISGNKNPMKKSIKKMTEVKLMDIRLEEQQDQDAVRFFVKKNIKIIKHLFNNYCYSSNVKKVSNTFEEKHGQYSVINVSEVIKMLKDYNITQLQMPKDDLLQLFRLINRDILKKQKQNQSSMLVLDFEGFVELLLQVSVYIFSFEADLSPQQYMQKLFDHFRDVAKQKKMPTYKLFHNPDVATIGDTSVLVELNRRLAQNPGYKLPEGYTKGLERDIVMKYEIPEYFGVDPNQKMVLEIFDQIFADAIGIHFLEPQTEFVEVYKARQLVKNAARNPQRQVGDAGSKRYMQAAAPRQRARSRLSREKLSTSVDVNPIRSTKTGKKISNKHFSSQIMTPQLQHYQINPTLNPFMKVEVAKAGHQERGQVLEAAYALEEILQAVEKGETTLEHRKSIHKPKIINKAIEEKHKKAEEDEKLRIQQQKRLEQRKAQLKEQLSVMKEQQSLKARELAEQKKAKAEKEKLKQQKFLEQKKADFEKIAKEGEERRNQKQFDSQKAQEDEERKQQEELRKQQQHKESLKRKKQELQDRFMKQTLERKQMEQQKEEEKKRKEEHDKNIREKNSKLMAEQRQKMQEKRELYRQKYQEYRDSEDIKNVFNKYDRPLYQMFELYSKHDGNQANGLTYNAYKQMGPKTQITPSILSNGDFLYLYKAIMRDKIKQAQQVDQEDLLQSHKMNYNEFEDLMFRIAILAKSKLNQGVPNSQAQGGGDTHRSNQARQAVSQKVISMVNEMNVEKEYDTQGVTPQTLENLFKFLRLKLIKDNFGSPSTFKGNFDQLIGLDKGAVEDLEQP